MPRKNLITFNLDTYGVDVILPSGLDTLSEVASFNLSIRKPDKTIIIKELDDDNIVAPDKLKFTFVANDINQEGVYDYFIINTTAGINEVGELLQFFVAKGI